MQPGASGIDDHWLIEEVRMYTLNPWTTGAALATTVTLLYALCAAAFALWPTATVGYFDAWFHGLNLAGLQVGAKPFTPGGFIYGLLGIAAWGFATGAVFALSYNLAGRLVGGTKT